ncbi:MAG: glycosyltransferase [Sphingomonas adhaesiva]|uniref:glycosyltransferase n=1 Tax=Sphingomonas adhaesiva TaxID=28212 RepID=UPI002FF5F949
MLRVVTLSTLFPDATRPTFGVFVERQAQALAARDGVSVRVVAPVGLPPWPLPRAARHHALATLPPRETWHGLPVARPRFAAIPATRGRWHAPLLARALRPVLDDLWREAPFDAIDASFFFPDGPAAVALGRRYDVPVSIKARGADIHFWARQGATRGQVRASATAADGLLAVSAAMRDDMAALGIDPARVRVHRTGVDLDRFVPVERRRGAPHVVSLGALIPRKGHDVVIAAIARLPGVTLSIVGEGPERARLMALARRLGVAGRVHLTGAVAHRDLPAILADADVMALASASEGLANAWVESLACGTPIVIADAGGAREVVTTPAVGRIVARDAVAFAGAIGDLIAAPPPRAAVRAAAERFTWAANAAALHEHLASLVHRHRTGRG